MPESTALDHLQQAVSAHQTGRFGDAVQHYRNLLALDPDNGDGLHLYGVLLAQMGRPAEAEPLMVRSLDHVISRAPVLSNLGRVLRDLGRLDESEAALRQAVALDPGLGDGVKNLGSLLLERRGGAAFQDLIPSLEADLERDPADFVTCYLLGFTLLSANRVAEAQALGRAFVQAHPGRAEAHFLLAKAYARTNHLEAALICTLRALELQPQMLTALRLHSAILVSLLDVEGADRVYQEVIRLDPSRLDLHSDRVYYMNMLDVDPASLFEAHADWGRRLEAMMPAMPEIPAEPGERDPNKRLRIGYLSPDFRDHSVAFFTEGPLAAHDPAQVEVVIYHASGTMDAVSERFKAMASLWRDVTKLDDLALAEQIRADRIDILVDLCGHNSNNRMLLFARKPAPIQVAWVGYPHTTGLTRMDARIVDAITDPPGAEAFSTEQIIRLENGFLCFRPPLDSPEPPPSPSLSGQPMTFGCFNNIHKISEPAYDAWARILHRVPGSRLLLKSYQIECDDTARRLLGKFMQRGIPPERILFRPFDADRNAHLSAYGQMDIALDPFPYNGTTTTCEALWMGVPMVALRGIRHAARVSASILTRVGLQELIAESLDAYVDIAVSLANSPARLESLNRSIRPRFQASPLRDEAGMARALEGVYRELWMARSV